MARSISARRSRMLSVPQRCQPRAQTKAWLIFPQPIAKAAHGFNHISGLAQLLAGSPNVGVNGASVDHTLIAPDFVQQTVPVLDPTATLHECAQQFKLKTGQVDAFPIDQNLMTSGIDCDRS